MPMRRWKTWIPLLTLVGITVGFLARRSFAPRREELIIRSPPAAQLPPLELPERGHSIFGQVVDVRGSGVPEALLWLRAGDEPHWTTTDAQGRFRLDGLEIGPWSAVILAQGFAPLALPVSEAADAQTLQLGAPLDPPPSLPPLERRPLSGVVTSVLPPVPPVSPVPPIVEGCEVVLTPVLPLETLNAPIPRRALVGADGRFEFPDLITGDYRIEVIPAWARGGSWPDLARPLEGAQARVFSHAKGGAPADLSIELVTGEMTGKLVEADGSAIEGALILVAQASDASRVWPPESSSADGSFSIRGLPAGKYLLSIRAGSAAVQLEVDVQAKQATSLDLAPLEVRASR